MRGRSRHNTRKKLGRFVRRKTIRDSKGGERTILQSPFDGLQVIAARLNELPDLRNEMKDRECPGVIKATCAAWTRAEAIVSAPSVAKASTQFTDTARRHPVRMVVEMVEDTPRPAVTSDDAPGAALWHLWLFYFRDHGWDRLKRCPVCQRWFVDTSKNRATARCSILCTWRWWNRARRQQARA